MATVVVGLTAAQGNYWTVPSDCYGTIQIECIGPGANADNVYSGGQGGGGGAYAKGSVTLSAPTGTRVAYLNWAADTWINFQTNAAPTTANQTTQGVKAAGGIKGGSGGGTASCVPTTGAFAGGASNGASSGGAAGPNGAGGAGNGSAGGSANGGQLASPGYEGNPTSMQVKYTDFFGQTYGPSNGSGKGYSGGSFKDTFTAPPQPASNYGGGGPGAGSNGLIIITYTSQTTPQGRYVAAIEKTGTATWRVPDGVTAIKAELIGPGSEPYWWRTPGYSQFSTAGYGNNSAYPWIFANVGGGGGAYALNYLKVTSGSIMYANIPNRSLFTDNKTWLNTTNAIPTSLSTGVTAAGGNYIPQFQLVEYQTNTGYATGSPKGVAYSQGGQAKDCLAQMAYSGGAGGFAYYLDTLTYSDNFRLGSAGGGGAAGPNGPGAAGGNGFYISTSTGRGTTTGANGGSGGGGAANGGGAGLTSTSTAGGAGGTSRLGVLGGSGSVAYETSAATSGTAGSGGGGGSYFRPNNYASFYLSTGNVDTTYYNTVFGYTKGGAGSTEVLLQWNPSGVSIYGPGSGSGGAGRIWYNNVTSSNPENNQIGYVNSAGKYGGGQGMGTNRTDPNSQYSITDALGVPGQGLVIISYSITKNLSSAFLPMFM